MEQADRRQADREGVAGITLREARRGDELAVAELHVRSWQEAYRGLMPAEFLDALDPRERAGHYTFEANGPGAPTTLLALGRGEGTGGDPSLTNRGEVRPGSPAPLEPIVGFVTFGPSRDEDTPGLGEVYALYVDPTRHRGGVGRLLMTESRQRLLEAGFTEAILWVLRGNTRAAGFYEREGWLADGATRTEQPYDIVSKVRRFRRKLP